MSIENIFEKLFDFYRSDSSVRSMFEDLDILVTVKFLDTNKKYSITIHQDQEIFLHQYEQQNKPDIKVRVKSKQLFIDLVEGKLPIQKQFTTGKIMITKGLMKIIKIYRKYVGEP